MTTPRTFRVTSPHMRGEDIENWQREIRDEFAKLDIDCPINPDGIYGVVTRSYTASLVHALGMTAAEVMADGVTPELRTKIRQRDLTNNEQQLFAERKDWRRKLRKRYASSHIVTVHRPVAKILEDSWGFHPPVHDGLDVITLPNAQLYAMVKCRVIDVRSGGWWGKAPSGDVSKGDGIIQFEILESVGPFKKGHHIGYGHAEHAKVKVGQVVFPGDYIGHAGLAVAWHIHLMHNDGSVGNRGVGNLDPRPLLDYAVKHG